MALTWLVQGTEKGEDPAVDLVAFLPRGVRLHISPAEGKLCGCRLCTRGVASGALDST